MPYAHTLFDIDRESHIATITLNKPERMNAIDQGDAADILDICKRIQGDDDIWIAIWTGAGRGFCSGLDLKMQAEGGSLVLSQPPKHSFRTAGPRQTDKLWFASHGAGT